MINLEDRSLIDKKTEAWNVCNDRDDMFHYDDVEEAILEFKKQYLELSHIDEDVKTNLLNAYKNIFGDFKND